VNLRISNARVDNAIENSFDQMFD